MTSRLHEEKKPYKIWNIQIDILFLHQKKKRLRNKNNERIIYWYVYGDNYSEFPFFFLLLFTVSISSIMFPVVRTNLKPYNRKYYRQYADSNPAFIFPHMH